MSLALYMDVHIRAAITYGLRTRGINVLTAQEDGAARFRDPELLDRATALGRVLFSQDDDLLVEAATRQAKEHAFGGVIYCHQQKLTVGQCVDELTLLAQLAEPAELGNQVIFLPLK